MQIEKLNDTEFRCRRMVEDVSVESIDNLQETIDFLYKQKEEIEKTITEKEAMFLAVRQKGLLTREEREVQEASQETPNHDTIGI